MAAERVSVEPFWRRGFPDVGARRGVSELTLEDGAIYSGVTLT